MLRTVKYLFGLACLLLFITCSQVDHTHRKLLSQYSGKLQRNTVTSLKAHARSGDLYIFKTWEVDSARITGVGDHYDYLRFKIKTGPLTVSLDEIALFETNGEMVISRDKERVSALLVQAMINIEATILCLTVPKACFGSCPTFYLSPESSLHDIVAEGFSSAILPRMAYTDLDKLPGVVYSGQEFNLTMKNEAFETHVIDELKLLLAPVEKGFEVFHSTNDKIYKGSSLRIPDIAWNEDGEDICHIISEKDGLVYKSLTDQEDLTKREELIFTFNTGGMKKDLGLVIDFRQSLVSTFLFYTTLDLMGDKSVELLAELESGRKSMDLFKNLLDYLGGIEVFVRSESHINWTLIDKFHETGPIAFNRQVLPLGNISDRTVEVKLRMAKGSWQIDQVGLVELIAEIEPIEIVASSFSSNIDNSPDVLNKISKADKENLVSLPGDQYNFSFLIPEIPTGRAEVILKANGYYLEWNRPEWQQTRNLFRLRRMMRLDPMVWKQLAREFKTIEDESVNIFWNSAHPVILNPEVQ